MSMGYVPGPCQIFLGVGGGKSLAFLGYSENGVSIRLNGSFRDVMSDFGGPEKPVDVQFMGEDGRIGMTLNTYNESVLQAAAARINTTGAVPGSIAANAVGALMVAQNLAYPIVCYAPYSTEAFQSGSIVPGYSFAAGYLEGEFETPISVLLKAPRVVFRVIPVWNHVNLTATLYTNTIPSLPAVN